jgi:hypothetical protein
MKTYHVIHHDATRAKRINTEPGYYVSINRESFRNVPVSAVIWSAKVEAENKTAAIMKAKQQHAMR